MGQNENGAAPGTPRTVVTRQSDRELAVTRTFNGPARLVFEAWSNPDLFRKWWAPKSFGVSIVSFEADVRTGGRYHLVMGHAASDRPMSFFGTYVEVVPGERIVWTNDEGDEDGPVTTVTFQEKDGETLVLLTELYPSKAALDDAIASGSTSGWDEQLGQLAALLGQTDRGACDP